MSEHIYLAGPMTGYLNFNFDAFHKAERVWAELGFIVHNPARHFGGAQDLPYATYMTAAIEDLVTCDGLVLLPGWWDSHGANVELVTARAIDLDIYTADGNRYRQGLPIPNFERLVKGRER